MRKEILLLLGALAFLVVFFCIPIYNKWLFFGVLNRSTAILYQAKHTNVKERMAIRFGCVYTQLRKVQAEVHAADADSALVLLPPDEYLHKQNIQCFHMPEPLEFYYFTGIRAVLATHPDAKKATWTVKTGADRKAEAVRIADAEELSTLIEEHIKYLPH